MLQEAPATFPEKGETPKDCPFCGSAMVWTDTHGWFHPGVVTDDDCLLSGTGIQRQLDLWNTRADPQP